MTRAVELILRPSRGIGKLRTLAAWGLPCTEVSDAGAFRAGSVDFLLAKTHLFIVGRLGFLLRIVHSRTRLDPPRTHTDARAVGPPLDGDDTMIPTSRPPQAEHVIGRRRAA
jgi:hypothetical protein